MTNSIVIEYNSSI